MALQHAALHDTVCLEARGADAAAFLHAQLSRAVADLDPAHAPLAGWADARGRVRALLRVCRLPDRWLLVTPRDGADDLLKKLRMFVLRSKVTLALRRRRRRRGAARRRRRRGSPRTTSAADDTRRTALVRRDDLAFVRVGPSYWQALGAPARAACRSTAGLAEASASDGSARRDRARHSRRSRPRSRSGSSRRC